MIMNKLKELRKSKNITQVEFVKIINMSQNGYSQYESEINDMPTDLLRKLSDFYNTSIDYILGITDVKENYPKSIFKNDKNVKILNRLKEIREDRDLFQKDIANIIGMSQTGYSNYETGVCDIPTKILKELAYYYDVSIDYLLYMTDERKCHKKTKKEI